MDYEGVVDVDEEGNLLLPGEVSEVHSLQLRGGSHVRLKLATAADPTIVNRLQCVVDMNDDTCACTFVHVHVEYEAYIAIG